MDVHLNEVCIKYLLFSKGFTSQEVRNVKYKSIEHSMEIYFYALLDTTVYEIMEGVLNPYTTRKRS